MYLVDTLLLSEARKRTASTAVRVFFAATEAPEPQMYLSVVTIAEVQAGIARLRDRNDAPQAERLAVWLGRVLSQYENRILPVTTAIAGLWGDLLAQRGGSDRDKLIAATAKHHNLRVATLNDRDFPHVETYNPDRQ